MADWSIKIVSTKNGVGFQPDLQGAKVGDPLQAQQNDLVTWNNTTNNAHQPWQTDSNYQPLSDAWVNAHPDLYLSDSIPGGEPSSPSYNVAQPTSFQTQPQPPNTWTVYYFCKLHPTAKSERGTIEATVPPSN